MSKFFNYRYAFVDFQDGFINMLLGIKFFKKRDVSSANSFAFPFSLLGKSL